MLNIKRLILALTAIISITTAWAQQGAQILSDELTYNFGTIAEADGFASHTFTIRPVKSRERIIRKVAPARFIKPYRYSAMERKGVTA